MVSVRAAQIHSWKLIATQQGIVIELVLLAVLVTTLLLMFPALDEVLIPLLTLIPIMFGSRYGFVGGSAAALLLMLVLCMPGNLFTTEDMYVFPKLQATVYLLCGSAAGLFCDHWSRTLSNVRALAELDRLRLAQFTNTYHVLKASHAQLERRLAGSRTSLRTALQQLKDHITRVPPPADCPLGGLGAPLLKLLAESCHLHSGAAYEVNTHGLIGSEPAASFGKTIPLSPFHPMLREALSTGSVVSVRRDETGVEKILAVVPLIDSLGHIHGVISINEMAFIAINQNNLDLMAVIARYAGDVLSAHAGASSDIDNHENLLRRLQGSIDDARLHRLPLAVVGFRILKASDQDMLAAYCLGAHRGIDQSWRGLDRHGQAVVIVMMPMPDEAAAHRHVQRIRDQVAQQHGSAVATGGIESFVIMLENNLSAEEALAAVLRSCETDCPSVHVPSPVASWKKLTSAEALRARVSTAAALQETTS